MVSETTWVVTQETVNLYRTATVNVKPANLRKQNNKVHESRWHTQYNTNFRDGGNWLKNISSDRQWQQR